MIAALRHSRVSDYEGCETLIEELEVKELEAMDEERLFEAFILQFSFIELKIEGITKHFSAKANLTSKTREMMEAEQSVHRKIGYFELVLAPFVDEGSRSGLSAAVDSLRAYNVFRNDLLHGCADHRRFQSAMHIDMAIEEAYAEGLKILDLLCGIRLKGREHNNVFKPTGPDGPAA